MAPTKQFANPFYVVLPLVGVLFVVTSCAYSLLAIHGHADAAGLAPGTPGHHLLLWMEEYGFLALMVELALLAIATFAAIATDGLWAQRSTVSTALREPTAVSQSEASSSDQQPFSQADTESL